VVQPGDNLTRIAKKLGYKDPMILARANNLKDPNFLQVGQILTLPENSPSLSGVAVAQKARPPAKAPAARPTAAPASSHAKGRKLVKASWYGSYHHGKLMANGKPFNMYANTVAHKKLPLGTTLNLTNPRNGASVQVQVTDRGPYIPGRNLDLSYGVARKLGVVQAGVAKVWMEEG
jgi:rare lipoprotein A